MHELTFFRTWLPVIYLYVVGGLIFFVGMIVIMKAKSIKLALPKHRMWFVVLFFGYFYYLFLHVGLTLAALHL